MGLFDILSFFGFPALFISMLGALYTRLKNNDVKTQAICRGVQALLRNQLYGMYNKYYEKGFAPLWARENFENMYQQYHSLGANGVMNDIYSKFMDLPTEKEDDKRE